MDASSSTHFTCMCEGVERSAVECSGVEWREREGVCRTEVQGPNKISEGTLGVQRAVPHGMLQVYCKESATNELPLHLRRR